MGDPGSDRVTRAQAREAAGWNPGLVSALNILEYGCDAGDYDEEVLAVLELVAAARALLDEAEGMSSQICQNFCVGWGPDHDCEPDALKRVRALIGADTAKGSAQG
jgi:hypothetical protein